MYKVGDEVLVKGEVVEVTDAVPYPTKVKLGKGENAYVFSNDEICFCDRIVKTYTQGLADAWELADKVYGMSTDEREAIFGTMCLAKIMKLSPEEALAKIEAYEREKEIKPTDVVSYNGKNWIVTEAHEGNYSIWNGNMIVHTANVKKVGSVESLHNLAEWLRQIGE